MSIVPRMSRGLTAQGFSQATNIFIRFAEVPLFLGYWGTPLYGEWLMVSAIPTYLAVGDGGFAIAANNEMTMRAAAGNRCAALSVFQSISVLMFFLSIGLISILVCILPFLPLSDWLAFKEIQSPELDTVLLLLTTHVLVNFQLSLLYGGYQSEGRYATGMLFQAVANLLAFMGLAASLISGGGPEEAAAAFLGGRVGALILMRLHLYRSVPWIHYGWKGVSIGEIRRLFIPAVASLALPLGNALNIQGLRLVVGLTLGPPAVATFTAIRTLSRLAMQPQNLVSRLVQPELSLAFGRDDPAAFRSLLRRSSQISLWLGVIVCVLLGVAGEELLRIWTHGKITMETSLFLLFLIAAAINSLWYSALMVPIAINRHGYIALVHLLVFGVAACSGAYIGTKTVGLDGAAWALLLAEIAMAVCVLPVALRMCNESWLTWANTVVRPPKFAVWLLMHRGNR